MPNHDEGNYCAVWNQIYKKHCWFSINLNILYYPLKCPFMSVLVYCPLLACLYWSNSPELRAAQSTVRQTSNQPTQRKVLHRLRQRPRPRYPTKTWVPSLSHSTKYFINFILHIKPLEFVWQRRPVVALVGPRPDRNPSRRKTCSDALRKNPNRGQEENDDDDDDGQRSLHSAWTQAHVYERNQICNRSFFSFFLVVFMLCRLSTAKKDWRNAGRAVSFRETAEKCILQQNNSTYNARGRPRNAHGVES